MFDNGKWLDVAKSLQNMGVANWQIGRAFAVLQNGGSVQEAEDAMFNIAVRVPATYEAEYLVAQAERQARYDPVENMRVAVKIQRSDVFPDGTIAWPSNY